MITAVIERCAGIDVGKKILSVCLMVGAADEDPRTEIRTYGTTNADLERLRQWLVDEHCTHAVLESTGNYWKPIFNVLEDTLTVVLANAEDVKGRKGHKTDAKDAWWLAHLLRHAMIRPSFIPPRAVRELRDLTRRRRQLLHDATSERNRIEKVLEDANIKLSSVLSDLFGVSGQMMLDALLEGKASPSEIAQLAQRQARRRIPELTAALEGHRMSEHHRLMIRYSLRHLVFLEHELFDLDEQILHHVAVTGLQPAVNLLESLPGVQQASALSIVAEIGSDMSPFPSAAHLSSWAGLCPGNRRSAGKDKGGRTTRGNRWLRATLTQCAWAASAKKDCHLKGKFWRLAAEGKKRAVVAVAHALLVIAYQVLTHGTPYEEQGKPTIEERQKRRLIRHHVRCLGRLGVNVGFSSQRHQPNVCHSETSTPSEGVQR
jgi:transposase